MNDGGAESMVDPVAGSVTGSVTGSGRFSMLMVCTGNIGRSPMMQQFMRRTLSERGITVVEVVSAGTWGQVGEAMEPGARQALIEAGVDPGHFEASPLTVEAIMASDLVLVATRDHRRDVVSMVPSAVRRTFTLHELARIATSAPPAPGRPGETAAGTLSVQQLQEAVAWAAQVRGTVPRPASEDDDDIADPLGAPIDVYRSRATDIRSSVERIASYLLAETQAG